VGLDAGAHDRRADRLEDIVDRAELEPALLVLDFAFGRQKDHRNADGRGIGFQSPAHLKPSSPGISMSSTIRSGAGLPAAIRQRALAIFGGFDMILVGESLRQRHQVFRSVVDHQHSGRSDQTVQLFHCPCLATPLPPGVSQPLKCYFKFACSPFQCLERDHEIESFRRGLDFAEMLTENVAQNPEFCFKKAIAATSLPASRLASWRDTRPTRSRSTVPPGAAVAAGVGLGLAGSGGSLPRISVISASSSSPSLASSASISRPTGAPPITASTRCARDARKSAPIVPATL